VGDAEIACRAASLDGKSGRPLVWFSSWRRVTLPQALGRRGNRWAMMSSSDSLPWLTSESAAAPL
jgi:hypothetical protein